MSDLQLFPALDAATEAALRASIVRFGVLVPVFRDQDGRTLDGHQRARIADELGAPYEVTVLTVVDDEEARELAVTLNADRRQLTRKQRIAVVASLRAEGHSLRAIAGAVGAPKSTVADDVKQLSGSGQLDAPERITGRDGKSRPGRRPGRKPRSLPPAPGRGETPAVTEARRQFEAAVEAAGGPETDEGQRLLESAEDEEARLRADVAAEATTELAAVERDDEAFAAMSALLTALNTARTTFQPHRLVAAVAPHRREQAWRDLRRAGTFLAAIALALEED